MSSTRLPGKVLRPLAGAPMLLRQIERLGRCARIDRLVVATSLDKSDDVLAAVMTANGVPAHRGELEDVLARYVGALDLHGPADHVVRLTGDCPLADPELIDRVIDHHLRTGADYTSNTWGRRSFPKGLDAEVMRASVLAQAAAEASAPYDREHVTPFIYARPDRYRLEGLTQRADEGDVRWTVDLPEDYEFAAAVFETLYPEAPAFTSEDIRAFVHARPELARLGGERRV
jgi:spore coat polysaccharide biosynthesis protein SpsF